jgi:hypothetical protein
MIFKELNKGELDKTRSKWEADIELLEELTELVRPSLYWSALDAAAARITGELESRQYGLFEDGVDSALALVAVHFVHRLSPPYLKVREIRLEPSLSYEIDDSKEGDYFVRHRKITEAIGAIFTEVILLSNSSDRNSINKIKIYGSTAVEIEMFAQVVMNAKEIEKSWGLQVSTHGHWLQFEKN